MVLLLRVLLANMALLQVNTDSLVPLANTLRLVLRQANMALLQVANTLRLVRPKVSMVTGKNR